MNPLPRKSTVADEKVGRRIKLRRKLIKMSQTELGEQIGVSFQQIQKYERGGNRIGASRLIEIARALRVDPTHFLEQTTTDAVDGNTFDQFIALPESGDLVNAVLKIESRLLRRQLIEVAITFGKLQKADGSHEPPADE